MRCQQIRTAVDGFADRYLASRSGHRFCFALQRYNFFFILQIFPIKKSFFYFFFHQNAKLQHKSIQIKRAIKERNYIKIK